MRGSHAPEMETRPVEPFRPQDRVVDEALGTGKDRQGPKGQPPPAGDLADPIYAVPAETTLIQLQPCLAMPLVEVGLDVQNFKVVYESNFEIWPNKGDSAELP